MPCRDRNSSEGETALFSGDVFRRIEYAIPTTSFVNVFHSSAVTLKAEYLHYDLGRNGNVNGSSRVDGNLVRGGINYKLDLFGAGAAPVVARY